MRSPKLLLMPFAVASVVVSLVVWVAVRPAISSLPLPAISSRPLPAVSAPTDVAAAAARVDTRLQQEWHDLSLEPAAEADELQVLRRLALALVGTGPSLDEIHQFEADTSADRLEVWTARYVADSRFVEYFAARLGDVFVDPVAAELDPHQRERFARWLGNGLQRGQSYAELVREMTAGRGPLADLPASTFVAFELSLGEQAAERLAARSSRAFLGQRIDCAQCHDHPFAEWTQAQFEGLAAHYGQVRYDHGRVQDTRPRPFVIKDDRIQEEREVAAVVPFRAEWVPDRKHLRAELADWLTHRDNRRFRRAIANRVWGLMFGRAYFVPVDDLPDPGPLDEPDVLDLLAEDLAEHNDDVRRLIHVISATQAFRLASTHPVLDGEEPAQLLEDAWAVFPVSELGPQQMIRAMYQAASPRTIRSTNSSTFSAIRRYERQSQFVDDYGIAGDAEDAQASTIPHTVQRLNGGYVRQFSKASLMTGPGRIAWMSSDDATCLENCYLACLSRRPTVEEQAHFLPQLAGNLNHRKRAVEDIYWTLFNSAEFCWNH